MVTFLCNCRLYIFLVALLNGRAWLRTHTCSKLALQQLSNCFLLQFSSIFQIVQSKEVHFYTVATHCKHSEYYTTIPAPIEKRKWKHLQRGFRDGGGMNSFLPCRRKIINKQMQLLINLRAARLTGRGNDVLATTQLHRQSKVWTHLLSQCFPAIPNNGMTIKTTIQTLCPDWWCKSHRCFVVRK